MFQVSFIPHQRREDTSPVAVAVKVLHPNIRLDTDIDLFLLGAGASFLELFPPLKWLDPRQSVEHFGDAMRHQVNNQSELLI